MHDEDNVHIIFIVGCAWAKLTVGKFIVMLWFFISSVLIDLCQSTMSWEDIFIFNTQYELI